MSAIARPLGLGTRTPAGFVRPAGDAASADLPALADPRTVLPRMAVALIAFSVVIVLVTAPFEIGPGYGYGDVMALCIVGLAGACLSLLVPWTRLDEDWLLLPIGGLVVFAAALATMTWGGASPYVILYAPILAGAGWFLRPRIAVLAVVLVVATEIWRAAAVDPVPAVPQIAVALPFLAVLAAGASLAAHRLLASLASLRQDQVRSAVALRLVRDVGRSEDGLADVAATCARVFDAEAAVVPLSAATLAELGPGTVFPSGGVVHVAISGEACLYGLVTLRRERPYSSTEIRLMGLLAEIAGRAIDSRRLIERMRHDAERDPLTGLGNRRAFVSDLERVKLDLDPDETLTLVMFDLDGLNRVNDTAGHPAGDQVLRDMAARLMAQVRIEDGVYRLGGDEFAVLARRSEPGAIVELGERIREAAERVVRDPAATGGTRITASVGVACAGAGDAETDLVALADVAMYGAKAAGGNRVVVREA